MREINLTLTSFGTKFEIAYKVEHSVGGPSGHIPKRGEEGERQRERVRQAPSRG